MNRVAFKSNLFGALPSGLKQFYGKIEMTDVQAFMQICQARKLKWIPLDLEPFIDSPELFSPLIQRLFPATDKNAI